MSTPAVPLVWEVTEDFPEGYERPMTAEEVAQLQADRAAFAALPPPVDPMADVIAQVLSAPDFATAKTNLAAYIAKRKAA